MRPRVVEDSLILSLHRVLREHRKGHAAPFVVAVSLAHDRPFVRVRCDDAIQELRLAQQPHNLGGTRWFLVCECGERAFTLYRPVNASRYLCRRCHGLRYRSENLTRAGRVEHRASRLARRLGGSLFRPSVRLKGMWHSTFVRRREEAELTNLRAMTLRLPRECEVAS